MEQTPKEQLIEAIRDNLSPQTVAAIAAHLQPAWCGATEVTAQMRWFGDTLVEIVGGHDQLDALCNEIGL